MELYKWTIASIAIGYLMTHRQRLPLEPQSVELEPTLPAQKWGTWATTMSQDFRKMLTKESTFWGFPSFRQVSDKPRYMGKAWKKAPTGGCGLLMMPWGLRLKPGTLFLVKGSCRLRPPKFCFGNCPDAQVRHFPSQNHWFLAIFLASKEPSCAWTASAGCRESTGWITSHDIWEWFQILDQGTVDLGHFQCQPFILYPTLTHPSLEDFWSDQLDQGADRMSWGGLPQGDSYGKG